MQQIDLATAINELAARIAADPSLDIAAEAAKLERVSRGGRASARGAGGIGRRRRFARRRRAGCADMEGAGRSSCASLASCPCIPNPGPACARPLPTTSRPTHSPLLNPQDFSGATLTKRIESKVTSIPEIVKQITEQQADLGKAPVELRPTRGGGRNTAGIIAGSVIGAGIALGIVALALLVIRRRRAAQHRLLAGSEEAAAAAGAGARAGGRAGAAAAAGGPVGEGVEAEVFYQQRSLRTKAALQRHASTDAAAAAAAAKSS